jgi:hypothetical protein
MPPSITDQTLHEYIDRRDLISLCRDKIDTHSIQGFILACSKTLVLLQYVYDFQPDGFLLLRRKDITQLKSGDSNRFQRQLLAADGVLDRVDFTYRAPVHSYDAFLASRSADEIVIVENETAEPPEFFIGTVSSVAGGTLTLRHFTGTGQWVEPEPEIPTAHITSCKIETSYGRAYQRHFGRIKEGR